MVLSNIATHKQDIPCCQDKNIAYDFGLSDISWSPLTFYLYVSLLLINLIQTYKRKSIKAIPILSTY